MNFEEKKMTLEERLERAARSQAASPEAAVSLVRRLAQTHTALVFTGRSDLQLMSGLIGDLMESLEEDLMRYGGFCRAFLLASEDDGPDSADEAPFQLSLGLRASSALVLLGLMLLDHARGKQRDKSIYHCTRMTLGQYVDALSTFFLGDRPPDRSFRSWREIFLSSHDLSLPLAEVLEGVLRQYTAGWRVLDQLDHTLRCAEDLSRYLEEEKTAKLDQAMREAMRQAIAEMGVSGVEVVDSDERETYPDPHGHFYALAREYPEDVPDPAGEEPVRERIFLPRRDFTPRALEALIREAPSPEFRALLEEQADPELLRRAIKAVNGAVSDLFMLWAGPYTLID